MIVRAKQIVTAEKALQFHHSIFATVVGLPFFLWQKSIYCIYLDSGPYIYGALHAQWQAVVRNVYKCHVTRDCKSEANSHCRKILAISPFHFCNCCWVGFFSMTKIKVLYLFGLWAVSSVPFPFWFPFQLHWELVSSGISSQSVQNILIWCVTKNERPILVQSLLRFSEMASELITFNLIDLRCHSSSTRLGTRTGYWRRGTDETPQ